jgi:hypothetical protein
MHVSDKALSVALSTVSGATIDEELKPTRPSELVVDALVVDENVCLAVGVDDEGVVLNDPHIASLATCRFFDSTAFSTNDSSPSEAQ